MNKKSIKKNYIYNLSYQVLILFTPLITTPYISRVLGADGIGEVSFTESVASYFVLFATLGITTYGQREISYVQENRKKRSVVFWNTKVLEFITSTIAIILYVIFSFHQKNVNLSLIFTLNILAVFVDVTWLFQGLEEFGKIVLRNIIVKILNIAYLFLVIRSSNDVNLYAFGLCFFTFVSNVSLWVYLPKYVDRISVKQLNPFKEIPVVISLFIPTIAISIYTVLDKTMIGIITKDTYENGYYEQALKISRMVLTTVTALGTVMIPRIGYHFERKDINEVERLMYRGYRFVWCIGTPLCLGLVMISSNFVPWFFGTGYERVSDLLKVLSFLILAIGINNVTGMQYLIPTKRQNLFTLTVAIGAVVNFILNCVLIRIFQSIGAAVASVVAETVIAIVQLVFVRHELKPMMVLKEGIHYYCAGAAMAILLYIIERFLTSSFLNTVIMIVVGAFIYFGILIIMKDEFLISNLKAVLSKVINKLK
ncbi:polysaccharide biosynthesis protein [Lachnoclostridium sp. An196]|uniref:flippase n=1 Tax=Lachnoclostridium sp. An196 TaxID=1965583 RepID=UPI000B3734F6|nr:flippase [Lachnoclostridium sp. An196]OUP22369.1 polysaccharide biosynthesis protein [Lachnoclostridium sp. An196]